MNIIANNVASKLFVAFVAASMLFTLATPAKAATVEELQAMIAQLTAQIAALSGGSSAPAAGCTFTRALTVGSEGADVKCLQDYLTPTYFSNAGGSTGYFGPVTAAAVAAWQSANGVMPAAGYFGPVSQAKYNALMAAAGPVTGGGSSSDDEDDSSTGGLSGEASLFDFEIDSASDDTIEESSEDQEVGVATVEFQNGDARITRLDVRLNSSVEKVWNVFEEVALFVDGDEIGRMDASAKSDYINTATNAGTLRFSGLDLVAEEDEEVEITIVASIGNLDTADLGAYTFTVTSMRFVDGTDVTSTLTSADDTDFNTAVSVTIGTAGGDDELIVKTSQDDPDGTTFELKDNAKSDWYNVFTFDLDTDDSVNDIELTTVVVHVEVSSSTYALVVDDAELIIDGTTIDSVTASGTGATVDLSFDVDGDVVIEAGDRVAAELMLKFNALPLGNEGITVQGSVTAANRALIDATGADDLATSQLTGAATGDVHTLRTSGVDVSAVSMTSAVTAPDGNDNDYATYTLVFDVTAFNQDVYISTSPATAVTYTVEDGSGVATTSATTVTLSSTAKEVSSAFEVTEGSTKRFTLKVTYDPSVTTSTAARVQLETLVFGSAAGAPTGQTWTASPEANYRTAVETIVD